MEQKGNVTRLLHAVNCVLGHDSATSDRKNNTASHQTNIQDHMSRLQTHGVHSETNNVNSRISDDVFRVMRDMNPIEEFSAELCSECVNEVAQVPNRSRTYPPVLIHKDPRRNDNLITYLLDRSCRCEDNPKEKVTVTLLDVIATSGELELLHLCIKNIVRNHRQLHAADETQSLTWEQLCLIPDHTERVEQSKTNTSSNDHFSNITVSNHVLSYPNPQLLSTIQCSNQEQPSDLEDISKANCAFENNIQILKNRICNIGESVGNKSIERMSHGLRPINPTDIHLKRQLSESSNNILTDSQGCGKEKLCDTNTAAQNTCIPAACSVSDAKAVSDEDVLESGDVLVDNVLTKKQLDCFKRLVPAPKLVSFLIHAIEYHHPQMLSCALALEYDDVMKVVTFCKERQRFHCLIHLLTLMHVYGGTQWKNKQDIIDGLGVDVCRLKQTEACYLAWYMPESVQERINELIPMGALEPAVVELCRNCRKSFFPDSNVEGFLTPVKFHRSLHDNEAIFDAIVANHCSCLSQEETHMKQISINPVCAAAVAGNPKLLSKLLPTIFLYHNELKTSTNVDSGGCMKTSKPNKRKTLSFLPKVRHALGETVEGELLVHALYGGSDDCVELLLNAKELSSITPKDILQCLVMALRMGRDDVFMRIVYRFGVNVKDHCFRESTPLMLAAHFGRPLLVQVLLCAGADPQLRNISGYSAAHLAIYSKHKDADFIAKMILSQSKCLLKDTTVMEAAILECKLSIVNFLVDMGITYVIRDETERKTSTSKIHTKIKIPLVHYSLINVQHWTFGDEVIDPHVEDLLKIFISKQLDCSSPLPLHDTYNEMLTPLHLAVAKDRGKEVLELLIRQGVAINVYDNKGRSPLYLALQNCKWSYMRPLLTAGASFCTAVATSSQLTTPKSVLHNANIVYFLLHCGYRFTKEEQELFHKYHFSSRHVVSAHAKAISKLLSHPPTLCTLSAASLREGFGEQFNIYLSTVGCPVKIVDFITCQHLMHLLC